MSYAEIAATLRGAAASIRECHSFNGEWFLEAHEDHSAKSEHDRALQLADWIENQTYPVDVVCVRMDPHHAAISLALANMTGACRALLKAVHKTGGFSAPIEHEAEITAAFAAIEAATVNAIDLELTGKAAAVNAGRNEKHQGRA